MKLLEACLLVMVSLQIVVSVKVESPALETHAKESKPSISEFRDRTAVDETEGRYRSSHDSNPEKKLRLKHTQKDIDLSNQYLQYKKLSDLVAQRPFGKQKKLAADFAQAFAKHEDVRNIDLHQKEEAILANEFSRLRDPKQNSGWQKKMTLALGQYLADAKVHPKMIDAVLGYQHGQRLKRHSDIRSAKQTQDPEAVLKLKERYRDTYRRNKGKREESKQISGRFFVDMDQWRQRQTGKLSAIDVVKQSETLRPAFLPGREMAYHRAVKLYLQRMRYSPEEIFLAQSVQSKQLLKARQNKYKAQGKNMRGEASTSGQQSQSQGTSDGRPSRTEFTAQASVSAKRTKKRAAVMDRQRHSKKSKDEQMGLPHLQVHPPSFLVGDPSSQVPSPADLRLITGRPKGDSKDKEAAAQSVIPTSASLSRSGEAGLNVDELEAGPWWEDGYFED